MNFSKKALLGLLVLNLIAGSQIIATNEQPNEEEETSFVGKKTVIAATVLGFGIATYIAYNNGVFDKKAFLRNNKVSLYVAEKTAPAREYVSEKTGIALTYVANKTAPIRNWVSEKATSGTNAVKNAWASVAGYFGSKDTMHEISHLEFNGETYNTIKEAQEAMTKNALEESTKDIITDVVTEEASLNVFQKLHRYFMENTDLK